MNMMHKQMAAIKGQPRLPLRDPPSCRPERGGQGTSGQGSTMNGERRTVNGERSIIPYARQCIDEDDIRAVVEVLRSDWLTTGPKVAQFEEAVAQFVGAQEAVAVNSGTAALHAAMHAIGIGPGDEVILPPMTFVATANSVVFQGGIPVFVDVDPDTLLIDPAEVAAKITSRTKAIIAVDYAGQPCDYDELRQITDTHGIALVADACHALGAEYKGKRVGTLGDLTVFSFHPVKHITTGEGGMITTDKPDLADRMRLFRNHGITRNPDKFTVHRSPFTVHRPGTDNKLRSTVNGQQTTDNGQWYYEMQDLGYNYRITDIQCALGISQLHKLPAFLKRRCEIAAFYHEALANIPGIEPLGLRSDVLPAAQSAWRMAQSENRPSPSSSDAKLQAPSSKPFSSDAMRHAPCSMPSTHAYHLYVIKIVFSSLGIDRVTFFETMREKAIGVNVHYIPVHLYPFYMEKFHTGPGLCPVAEAAYGQIISLPMFPSMPDEDVEKVIVEVRNNVGRRICNQTNQPN